MTVERGVGYRMADKNKKPRDPIGVIPVDSIFSPVRKVSYTVENTRVEQMTDRDKLILDVETDGSVTPREALASAGGTLLELVAAVLRPGRGAERLRRPGRGRGAAERLPDHDRGAEPVGALLQLPEARGHQHGRRPGAEVGVRADGHPQLRAEVDRRGEGQARGARARPRGRSEVAGADPEEGTPPGLRPGSPAADAVDACQPAVHPRGRSTPPRPRPSCSAPTPRS